MPHPLDYAIHKLIVSYRRGKAAAADQDRRDAEEVLQALSTGRGFEGAFQKTVHSLVRNKKVARSIREGIATFVMPGLRDRLLALMEKRPGLLTTSFG